MTTDESLGFVFPGQGSQSVGMLSALAEQYPLVKETYEEASGILGFDLWDLNCNGPEDELNRTANTQPALLTAGVAAWRVWLAEGGASPVLMAGHSLGEYTALVCAGVMSFEDAVSVVADRGRYMQEAVPSGTGSMAAILGMGDEALITLCERMAGGQVVSAANFNSTDQTVIAGHREAVDRVVKAAASAGAKRAVVLPISVPSHCALMRDAADKLSERLETIDLFRGSVPVLHNVDVSAKTGPAAIRRALVEQLYQPVRWVETIRTMTTRGIRQIIECGPGKVLCGLIKRIDRQVETFSINDPGSLQNALAAISGKEQTNEA